MRQHFGDAPEFFTKWMDRFAHWAVYHLGENEVSTLIWRITLTIIFAAACLVIGLFVAGFIINETRMQNHPVIQPLVGIVIGFILWVLMMYFWVYDSVDWSAALAPLLGLLWAVFKFALAVALGYFVYLFIKPRSRLLGIVIGILVFIIAWILLFLGPY
jgi:hypothetical protein